MNENDLKFMAADILEEKIYALICSHDGIKAKDIARELNTDRTTVNRYLYGSPYMHELCYTDENYTWHGLIRQAVPHMGIAEFSGFYDTVGHFMKMPEEEWFNMLCDGCRRIGRNLNDTRGLFHSFRDTRQTMIRLFSELHDRGIRCSDWEIIFELRIRRAHSIRIYADVLVLTENQAYSLEFKMKDTIDPEEIAQSAKYERYLNIILGKKYDVISALVLTKADNLYTYCPLGTTTAEIPVCAGNCLCKLFFDYL